MAVISDSSGRCDILTRIMRKVRQLGFSSPSLVSALMSLILSPSVLQGRLKFEGPQIQATR